MSFVKHAFMAGLESGLKSPEHLHAQRQRGDAELNQLKYMLANRARFNVIDKPIRLVSKDGWLVPWSEPGTLTRVVGVVLKTYHMKRHD